ncbi:hypothetical protein [Mucilaginibacter xinganensis]|uniref:Uncharacterized protein n=1 Tax=Mucilaginibacter xinganensis TaxID=1234841 RepID=A0A223NX17_9SPHI|nr:hypothetical protein [Mucilaginibacter xinganensis]ASU34417.1 hypothetical protein MuYL_2530 [Mucilaginibacter xinganensis]
MTGICAISHEGGWSISNDTIFDADKHLVVEGEKRYSKQILTIKINCIFDVSGQLIEGDKVECLFKSDDDKKYAFIGTVKSRGKQLTVIHELLKSERYEQILNKIKNHGKHN